MNPQFCGRTRREFLWQTGAGFTGLALTGLLSRDGFFGQGSAPSGPAPYVNPLAPRPNVCTWMVWPSRR